MDRPSYLDFDGSKYYWRPDVDYRIHPELYRVGKGEQGVLICEPYKGELVPYWRFKTPEIARASSRAIYKLFLNYLRRGDFVGADMARKFLQMASPGPAATPITKGGGSTTRRQAPLEKGTGDPQKALSASIFHDAWRRAEANAGYAAMKAEWRAKYG